MVAVSRGVRVAVVEDDALVRRALTRLLTSMGFAASSFASAEEVLSMMAPDSADCLIVDVHLPRLNGIELFHALKRRAWTIPVVFVTADIEMVRSCEMVETGAPCLLKPCGDQDLLTAITRLTANIH